MKPIDLLAAVAVNLAWGLNFAVAKLGVGELPPMLLIGLRYALTAVLLIPWLRWPHGQFRKILGISFTLGFLHFSLMITGLAGVESSVAAVAVQAQVPFAAILAFFFFRDAIGWRRAGGIALALVGIAVLVGQPHGTSDPLSLAMVIAASLVWAISSIQVKKLGSIDTLVLNAWIAVLAFPQLLVGSYFIEGDRWADVPQAGFWGWAAVVYMAVAVTVFGYGIWYRLLLRYPVTTVMPLSLLAPTFGVLCGIVLLGEPASIEKLVGAAITLSGVAIVLLAPRPVPPVEPEKPA
ncbi:EamA family transporter [Thalassobaculum sp.]|uniref:DMT family transporter n=1 Tax=Thalassobaculum sp. TaxID=2022740 RepID=UPI0032EE8A39